jgi:16S rRNA A1518/A1519 N6-dimethyltransferase RsmA/KsgA/DIM1 with predicted DNA glycosylase/AP lyase activity
MRRKTLRKSLGELGIDAGKVLGAMGLDPQMRPETLSPEQHLRLLMETGRACAMPR